jgi:hypothetical protein
MLQQGEIIFYQNQSCGSDLVANCYADSYPSLYANADQDPDPDPGIDDKKW